MLDSEEHSWLREEMIGQFAHRCKSLPLGCVAWKLEAYTAIASKIANYWQRFNTIEHPLSIEAKYMVLSAMVKQTFHDLGFVGFYTVEHDETFGKEVLIIGPYASNITATPKIEIGKGVCGEAWERGETQIVDDVTTHANYIACDDVTMSEIVLPYFDSRGRIRAVFDIDADLKNYFDGTDKICLEELLKALNK